MATQFSTFFRQFSDDFVHVSSPAITTDTNPVATPIGVAATKFVNVTADIDTVSPSAGGKASLGVLYNYVQGAGLPSNTTLHFMAELITPDASGKDVVIGLIGRESAATLLLSEAAFYLVNAGDLAYFTYTTVTTDTDTDNTPILVAGLDGGTGNAVIKWAVYYEA
jgi:hypothetical protein